MEKNELNLKVCSIRIVVYLYQMSSDGEGLTQASLITDNRELISVNCCTWSSFKLLQKEENRKRNLIHARGSKYTVKPGNKLWMTYLNHLYPLLKISVFHFWCSVYKKKRCHHSQYAAKSAWPQLQKKWRLWGGVTQVHVRLFLSSELPLVKQWRRIQ